MTILTLFKPWRTGHDLKNDADRLWHDVFEDFELTSHQKDLIKFFHIRYKCNNARDDFAASHRTGESNTDAIPFDARIIDHIYDQVYSHDTMDNLSTEGNVPADSDEQDQLGKNAMMRLARMMQAEQIMHTSGWMNKLMVDAENKGTSETFIDGHEKSATKWANILSDKR